MFRHTTDEWYFIGLCLEGFFFGLYSGIFAIYLQSHASKKDSNKMQKIIFYSLCALYVLSVALFVLDIADFTCKLLGRKPLALIFRIYFIQIISFGCCDFVAQLILIYRCWIVWGRNIRVVIIPSILAFAFLGTWLSYNCSATILAEQLITSHRWGHLMALISLALSLTVNALAIGLIVFRIFKVLREVMATSDDQTLPTTSGRKLWGIILALIESGVSLFSIQLARLLVLIVWTQTAMRAINIIIPIHQMLNGITPTMIIVRTSMRLSFYDMEETAIESFRASSHPDPWTVPETGSIGIVDQDRRDNDDIVY